MRDQLNEYRSEYGVDSPEKLTVEQTNQTLTETASEQPEVGAETIQDCKFLRRNLAFASAALSRLQTQNGSSTRICARLALAFLLSSVMDTVGFLPQLRSWASPLYLCESRRQESSLG
ncbi:hypothetical protein [Haloquadratum walsbyi]|jgi:hypothetical protein|uniref:Uncharacterized protein n=1 Tax=Haloquadratum walsbyi J07HQW2 TaxID=1238425 RepID=U1NHT0_9EURY|nr:hypothetical protein [Haloquadratum walsbyi]ERG96740.1 MAG: hypothetical protein J07HQW2_03223 [Haloquadratum walsbyi J07HQW2]